MPTPPSLISAAAKLARTQCRGSKRSPPLTKEPFHHVARGVDNAGPGQVDSATDADCTEVEGDPPSTQVSPQALPRAAKASKAAMKKAAAAAAPDDEPVASRTRAQKAARAGPP